MLSFQNHTKQNYNRNIIQKQLLFNHLSVLTIRFSLCKQGFIDNRTAIPCAYCSSLAESRDPKAGLSLTSRILVNTFLFKDIGIC